MADAHKNFATSLIAVAPIPATSGTAITVTTGEGTRFPAVPFNAVVCPAGAAPTPANAEVVRVTLIATDVLTITRTQESSSARTIVIGDRIYAGPTALSLTDIEGNHAAVGSITTIQPDDAAAEGSATTWARGDHKHAVAAASAGTIEPDDAAAEGSATSFARSDHKHAIAAAAPNSIATWVGGAESEGSATSFARSDHKHGIPWVGDSQVQLFPAVQYVGAAVSTATGGVNTYYSVPVVVLTPTTLTGIEFRNGATMNGNVRAALYNSIGTRVADRTSDLAQAGSANANRKVPFDSTYAAVPGIYYALIWFSSATATAFMAYVLGTRATTGTNATTTPTGPGTLTVALTVPMLTAY